MVSGLPAVWQADPAGDRRAGVRPAGGTGLRNPDKVLAAGWEELVRLLDEAHYVRYDFSTATKLLEVCQERKQRYLSMTKLMAQTKRGSELSARLQEIKHIGPVTAGIFTPEVAQSGMVLQDPCSGEENQSLNSTRLELSNF